MPWRELSWFTTLGHSSRVEEDMRSSPWPVLSIVSSVPSECSSDCIMEYLKLHERSPVFARKPILGTSAGASARRGAWCVSHGGPGCE